jgi:hypothetical protein
MGFDKFVAVSYEAHSTKYGPFALWRTRWACSPQTARAHFFYGNHMDTDEKLVDA